MEKKDCCGLCKYHVHEDIDDGWVCVNPDSDNFTDWTEYDDACEEFEQRQEGDMTPEGKITLVIYIMGVIGGIIIGHIIPRR